MEQQNTGHLHLKSVDAGSSYQTFQDNTTLFGPNNNDHSSVGSGSGSRSASRTQLVGSDDSDSKVKVEDVERHGRRVSDATAGTIGFVLKTISICLAFFCIVCCQIIDDYYNFMRKN